MHSDRLYVVVLGIAVIVIAALLNDVVAALTIAYDILVGGLLVAILGGFLWKRATGTGALWSMAVGTVVTLGTMFVVGDVLANEPIYYGLAASLARLRRRQPADPAHPGGGAAGVGRPAGRTRRDRGGAGCDLRPTPDLDSPISWPGGSRRPRCGSEVECCRASPR